MIPVCQKLSLAVLAVFLIGAPYVTLPELSLYDSKRVLQLAAFGLIALLAAVSLLMRVRDQRDLSLDTGSTVSWPVMGLFAVIAVSGLLSVFQSERWDYAWLEYTFFLLLLASVLLLMPTGKKAHYRLGRFIFAAAVIYAAGYLVIFWGNYLSYFLHDMVPLWPDRGVFLDIPDGEGRVYFEGKEVLYFANRRFFNHTQTWTLPLLAGLLVWVRHTGLRSMLFVLLSSWWMLVFASGVRGTTLAVMLAMLLLLILYWRDVRWLAAANITAFLAGLLMYWVFFVAFIGEDASALAAMQTAQSSFRVEYAVYSLQLWTDNLLLGVGPMHMAQIEGGEPYYAHPHNFALQFLAEWGSIAFIALTALGVMLFVSLYRHFGAVPRSGRNRLIFLTVCWSFMAALIHALLSGVMHTPMSQMWFILILAWLLGCVARYAPKRPTGPAAAPVRHVLYMVVLVVVLAVAGDQLSGLADRDEQYLEQYDTRTFYPRFWGQGLFE